MQENKKMLVLFGSPHNHGHTRELLESFLAPFREQKHWEIGEISAYNSPVKPCIGCRVCAKQEGCVYNDFDEIDKALRESDLLVVASPVYQFSFPAPLKAVLDRTQQYFEARFSRNIVPPIAKHRDAVLLLTMGSREAFGVEVTTYQLKRAFTVMNTSLKATVVWQSTDAQNQNGEEAKGLAAQAAERCLEGWV